MEVTRNFLNEKFCDDIENEAKSNYSSSIIELDNDFELCLDDNEKLKIIYSKRIELREKLSGSNYKKFFSFHEIKTNLNLCLKHYFDELEMSNAIGIEYSKSMKWGKYDYDFRRKILTLYDFGYYAKCEPFFNFKYLYEFQPLVEYIVWTKMFLKIKKMHAKLTDQKSSLPIYNSYAAGYDDNTDTKTKTNKHIVYNHMHLNDRIKVRNKKAFASEFKPNNNELLKQKPLAENIIIGTNKESDSGPLIKQKTTLDLLTGNESDNKLLLDFLQKSYSGKKGKSIAFMILALKENELIVCNDKSELYNALRFDFGDIGTDAGINKHWTDVLCKDNDYLKLVAPEAKRIKVFMNNLHKQVA